MQHWIYWKLCALPMATCHESVKQPERLAPEHDLICVLWTAGTRAGRRVADRTNPWGCLKPAASCETVMGSASETLLGLSDSVCCPGSQRFVINSVTWFCCSYRMCKTWCQSKVTTQTVLSLHKEQKSCSISSWPLFSTQFTCGVPGGLSLSVYLRGSLWTCIIPPYGSSDSYEGYFLKHLVTLLLGTV